jgi:hypothetical protein
MSKTTVERLVNDRTIGSPPPPPLRAEGAPAGGAGGRRHAAMWAVATLLTLAGCAAPDPPGRGPRQRHR